MLSCMRTLLAFALVMSSSTTSLTAIAAAEVPNYTVQIGQEQNAKMKGWLLNFIPPAGHHFNTEAPMKVTAFEGKTSFLKVGADESHVGYRLSDPNLVDGTEIDSSLFFCDDAKTFCVKKQLKFALTVNSELHALEFAEKTQKKSTSPVKKKSGKAKKDEAGFWDNDLSSAVAEASRLHKPILVDFYGIWCPPCNLYNETVYHKPKFKQTASKWVLLKMDADQATSFELKSRFKVTGYPTTLALKEPKNKNSDVADLNEIDRIVGYYPLNEFTSELNQLFAARKTSLDDSLLNYKQDYLRSIQQKLKNLILVDISPEDLAKALVLAQDGASLAPDDSVYQMMILLLKSSTKPEILKEKSSTEFLNLVWSNRSKETPDALVRFVELITTHPEQFSKLQIAWANDVLDQLVTLVNPETLSVPGVELSIADIDSSRVDVAEAMGDKDLMQKSYERLVASYKKLIEQFKAENSRGYHLELAYALWKSGKLDEAKEIFAKFINLYPTEFTFYFAAEKMYLELKEFAKAKEMGERAFEFGFGDSKIRAMERLMRSLMGNGDDAEALKRGSDFLATVERPDPSLQVRTKRYLEAVEKAVSEAEAKVNHK